MTNENEIIIDTETYNMVCKFKIIEQILKEDIKPRLFFQTIKNFLVSIQSRDPNKFHFDIARLALNTIDKEAVKEDGNVYQLAKTLLEETDKLNKKLHTPQSIKKTIEQCRKQDEEQKPDFYIDFVDFPEANEEFEHQFFDDGLSIWDSIYLKTLKSFGQTGSTRAKELKERFSQKEGGWDRFFWFSKPEPENEKFFFHSPAFLFLAEVLWIDVCCKLLNRQKNGHPAVARPIIEKMIVVTGSHKNKKFVEKEGEIICYDRSGEPILTAPAVDPNMIALFKEGVKGLSSLTGHKMLRWQVNAGFERWASGENDPRLIKIDGGYSKIAELIRCANKRDIATVREILHAQAHGYFNFPDGSRGNMITLRIEERHKNQEPSKIHIVLGDMLLPEYVCQLKRSDKLLVPIGDLPPLHGSPNSHASQAQLQLLVFQEFSNQSDRLSQEGSVLITNDQWKKLAYESGVSPEKIEMIISHWCHPDLFNCFLEKQGDEYRLASYYDRAQKFLEDQGKRRITNSERRRIGIEKKGKTKKS